MISFTFNEKAIDAMNSSDIPVACIILNEQHPTDLTQ